MEKIFHAIGHVCATERERAGRRRYEIAALLGADDPTRLRRFETGSNTPRDLDQIVKLYGEVCGVSEHQLWTRAVNLLHGDSPEVAEPSPESHIETVIAQALAEVKRQVAFSTAFQGIFDSRSMFDVVEKGMAILTPEAQFLRTNETFVSIVQRSYRRLIDGVTLWDLIATEDRATIKSEFEALLNSERSLRQRLTLMTLEGEVVVNAAASIFVDPATDEPLFVILQVERHG